MNNNPTQVFNDEDDARLTMVAGWYADYLKRIPSDHECRFWLDRIHFHGNVYYAKLEFLTDANGERPLANS